MGAKMINTLHPTDPNMITDQVSTRIHPDRKLIEFGVCSWAHLINMEFTLEQAQAVLSYIKDFPEQPLVLQLYTEDPPAILSTANTILPDNSTSRTLFIFDGASVVDLVPDDPLYTLTIEALTDAIHDAGLVF